MAKIEYELSVCGNCLCIVANDDWTGCRDEAEEETIRASMAEVPAHLFAACDADCEGWFTWSACDLCGVTGREDHRVIGLA